ncbi:hypothetical protein CTA1_10131 [Colletotrichum tanaceti]|uniref:Uncharacterized protein n=1 Tax=Colletotrichum tanaceti TaxID=1306861 RepID=A0A4U6WZ62_9PEZI|nr:hypothetical protein CTA1_10131 [Colletotrichum tanaceti]
MISNEFTARAMGINNDNAAQKPCPRNHVKDLDPDATAKRRRGCRRLVANPQPQRQNTRLATSKAAGPVLEDVFPIFNSVFTASPGLLLAHVGRRDHGANDHDDAGFLIHQ